LTTAVDEEKLGKECARLIKKAAAAPPRKAMTLRLSDLRAQLHAAEAGEEYSRLASLGLALEALQRESDRLPLTEQAYVALAVQYSALLPRVVEKCRHLAAAQDFTALAPLGTQLTALRQLDLSLPAEEGDCDPVIVDSIIEDDGANDPVIVTH
jgi:hypothetical protein